MDNSSACFSFDEENKLVLSVSKSDFEKIRMKLSQDEVKRRNFGIIRVKITQSDVKISPVEQLAGAILLRLESE